ncbi:DUF2812 domain-containing protein [Bacillaceae bacterium W0354]
MGKLIKKFRFITVDNFEKEEHYFKEMSEKGFHIEAYGFPFYKFRKGTPQSFMYQTDFQKLVGNEKDSYLQLFSDDGWEFVMEYPGVHGTWYYFRKPATGQDSTKIFTDNSSKIDLYRKVRKNWFFFFLIMTPAMLIPSLLTSYWTEFWTWSTIAVWALVALLYFKMTINLTYKIKQLTHSQTD